MMRILTVILQYLEDMLSEDEKQEESNEDIVENVMKIILLMKYRRKLEMDEYNEKIMGGGFFLENEESSDKIVEDTKSFDDDILKKMSLVKIL